MRAPVHGTTRTTSCYWPTGGVIEEHASQRSAVVGQRVVRRSVVVVVTRFCEIRGQLDVGVAIGRRRKIEGVLARKL
jgi:hypothetical protein